MYLQAKKRVKSALTPHKTANLAITYKILTMTRAAQSHQKFDVFETRGQKLQALIVHKPCVSAQLGPMLIYLSGSPVTSFFPALFDINSAVVARTAVWGIFFNWLQLAEQCFCIINSNDNNYKNNKCRRITEEEEVMFFQNKLRRQVPPKTSSWHDNNAKGNIEITLFFWSRISSKTQVVTTLSRQLKSR